LINNIDGSNLHIIYIPQTNKSPKKSAISINHLYYADDFEIDEEEFTNLRIVQSMEPIQQQFNSNPLL